MKSLSLLLILMFAAVLVGCSGAQTDSGAAATTSTLPSYAAELQGAVVDPPREIPNFTMASTMGEDFTLSDFRGKIVLLYFGYRACPDFCPTTFAELKQVYAELENPAEQVKVVFITVDPERDDIDNLTLYTHAFSPDFIGLRAEGDALQDVMTDFGVVANRRQLGDSPMAYSIDHTASVFLIAPDGRLQSMYLYGTDHRVITHDVNVILQAAA